MNSRYERLSSAPENLELKIVRINSKNPVVRRKLMDLGLLPGTKVKIVRRAPLGDPIEISVKGYQLSLRICEAEHIIVTKDRK